ncbi:AMP-binding protein, partial [Streptomyces sp. NPDC059456]|uniref:AMP-binding protein n=1 Tax=Streptomyces sp. NPDC059456 TaxID=3346838 RepID=UPI0036C2506D
MATPTLTAPPGPPTGALRPTGEGEPLPVGPRPPVHELVAGFARTGPARTAVSCGASSIAYGDLDAWAARVAAALTEAGVRRGGRVGVLVEPSLAMVAAVLGAMRCGAAYVPVDVSHPDLRVTDILTDAQVDAVLVTEASRHRLTGLDVPLVDAGSTAREPAADRPGGGGGRGRRPACAGGGGGGGPGRGGRPGPGGLMAPGSDNRWGTPIDPVCSAPRRFRRGGGRTA